MSKYSLDNVMMPVSHFNSYIARGGGGGGTPAPTPDTKTTETDPAPAAAAPTYTSTLPGLEGQTFSTEADMGAAEQGIYDQASSATYTPTQSFADLPSLYDTKTRLAELAANQMTDPGDFTGLEGTQEHLDYLSNKAQFDDYTKQVQDATNAYNMASTAQGIKTQEGAADLATAAITDPAALVQAQQVQTIDPNAAGTTLAEGTGQLTTAAPQITQPTQTAAATYDASTAAGKTAEALAEGYDLAGMASAFPSHYNATVDEETGEIVSVRKDFRGRDVTYRYSPESALNQLSRLGVEDTGKFFKSSIAQQGTVSDAAQVTAAQGETSLKAIAEAVGFDDAYIQQVMAGERQVSEQELIEGAKAANIPVAQAAQMLQGYTDVNAAKFAGDTPEAQAVTDYDIGQMGVAQGQVTPEELVAAQGVGLSAEQAIAAQSGYASALQAAQGSVAAGETITAQDYYNLTPTDIASLQQQQVLNAAKSDDPVRAQAAQTNWQSTIQAAQGTVGGNMLVNANDVVGAAKATEAVAATLESLSAASTAVAAQGTLSQTALAQAAQGAVSPQATIAGQMEKLMDQFKDGTPAWAAGSMRAANAAMAARGMGSSSMAGAAIVQAAMESAMPIAAQDAQMFMQMDMQNLGNRQQVSLANAAAQQGIELANLNNLQQAALQNSSQSFNLEMANLSNEQAVVVANAQFKSALQGQILDIKTQSSLANAAKYAEVNGINLNNRQQVAIQNSAQNLQVEMANLSNTQQTALSNLQVAAALQGKNLDNEQQMAVLQSQQNFDTAQFDASAKQQAFMQDAQTRAAMEGKAMDIRQQTALFNAARIAEVNDINLNNQQQVNLQKSTENLQIEVTNLSNRQQTELANAQLRAALQGKVLDNKQQAAVLNAARYAEVNNINLSNEQQAFVQEFAAKTTMEGKAMDNRQQTAIFNIANQIEERQIELTNEQQTRLFNATNKLNIDMAEMSNRQQTALANAQIEAAIRGQELSNDQQAAVLNAEKFAESANMNFTAEQSAALHNSTIMANIGTQVMNAKNAAVLQNAATFAAMDMANLNNRQQAAVQNAQSFLAMDMKNLDNEQQAAIFKAQQNVQAIFSDQAADNAAKQFNAASENQTEQFFANMNMQVQQFNAGMTVQREQFNAENALVVAQANAQWRQNTETLNTAAQNEANRTDAMMVNQFTQSTLDQIWQRERDIMDYAFRQAESSTDRALSVFLSDKADDMEKWQTSQSQSQADKEGMGYIFSRLIFG